MTSLVFRVAAGVVNTAARAANSLLEVMYPREDIGHIWDELAAPADPHPAGVADPAAEKVNPPNLSAAGSPSSSGMCDCTHWLHPGNVCGACGCNYSRLAARIPALTWLGWSEPAVLDVLSEHEYRPSVRDCACHDEDDLADRMRSEHMYYPDWVEHVTPLICQRIACDPTRAALALTSLQTQ